MALFLPLSVGGINPITVIKERWSSTTAYNLPSNISQKIEGWTDVG